ncbi:aldose epimerase family protein [Gilvimarinus xylanilyticus]|uniref:Aldose 1-epimerase n=1 Tax=Gilvimarinus xylanilyticus TaxID=2944139 RepID=A0A9X2I040_9GAMM|nr:aldose epimerase family protein [Gilvimarinus xylanilyticus]MCP8900964.1 galactose mutarotase [Gilvimarinus xylanilyticus]
MKRIGTLLLVAASMLNAGWALAEQDSRMKVVVDEFGKLVDGRGVDRYTIENSSGASIQLTNLGAVILSLKVPDKKGKLDDVVLGFDEPAPYLTDSPYFGAVVGRYANRIDEGEFSLNGNNYSLATNNDQNHLHGGNLGFDKLLWDGQVVETDLGTGVRFSTVSDDGDEGYPGQLFVAVTYVFTDDNALEINYQSSAVDDTVVNLSQHSYFNLAGQGDGSILDHTLQINADFYTPVDRTLIPTGEILSVKQTPFDFTQPKPIGRDIKAKHEQLSFGGGYDHNWVLRRSEFEGQMHLAAVLTDPGSGRKMEVLTDQPGLQFYSGNFLDGSVTGKEGVAYAYRGALALETQHYPDSPNQPHFPRTTLRGGESFTTTTIYRFSVVN